MISRKLLIAALVIGLPVLGLWWWSQPRPDPADSFMAYTDHSYRRHGEVMACLGGGLGLAPGSYEDELVDPAQGLTVRTENRHDFQKIWVWLAKGRTLPPAQIAVVKLCTGRPDNRP